MVVQCIGIAVSSVKNQDISEVSSNAATMKIMSCLTNLTQIGPKQPICWYKLINNSGELTSIIIANTDVISCFRSGFLPAFCRVVHCQFELSVKDVLKDLPPKIRQKIEVETEKNRIDELKEIFGINKFANFSEKVKN